MFGVAFIAAYLFLTLTQSRYPIAAPMRYVFQFYMFAIVGLYFVWCWRHGGQTLPMKTWKIRLVDRQGGVPSLPRAWWRYALAWSALTPALALYAWGFRWGLALIVLPFLWPLLDRERLFLHDRLAGTRLVTVT